MNKRLVKCDFCKYRVGNTCTVKPDSFYCRDAANEFYAHINKNKPQVTKSLRPWERKR